MLALMKDAISGNQKRCPRSVLSTFSRGVIKRGNQG